MSNWTSRTLSIFRRRKPQLCRDVWHFGGPPVLECQLPVGHTGVHKYNDQICWDRS
jgi:hypothetical protein